jgi:hypothetical protein
MKGLCIKQIPDAIGMNIFNVRYHSAKALRKFGATDIEDVQLLFGHYEMKLTWVPAAYPPMVVVHKTKRTRRVK